MLCMELIRKKTVYWLSLYIVTLDYNIIYVPCFEGVVYSNHQWIDDITN